MFDLEPCIHILVFLLRVNVATILAAKVSVNLIASVLSKSFLVHHMANIEWP